MLLEHSKNNYEKESLNPDLVGVSEELYREKKLGSFNNSQNPIFK
jgi:hypothetical protein